MRSLFLLAVLSSLVAHADAFWPLRAGVPHLDVQRFTLAAYAGDVKALRRHVLAGQNLNQKDDRGWTALGSAALAGDACALRFLLEEGADITTISDDRTDPLDVAKDALAERKKELEGQGLSFKQQHPPHLDSKLKSLTECVELLKDPAKVQTAARIVATEPKPRGWSWWLCFP